MAGLGSVAGMHLRRGDERFTRQLPLQPLLVAAAILILGLCITVSLLVAHQRESTRLVEVQARDTASTLALSLERYVALLAVRSEALAALLEIRPDIPTGDLEYFSSRLVDSDSAFRNLALAPDDVVSFVHPREGNAGVLGVDLSTRAGQGEVVRRMRLERRPVLAGPMNLVQGGIGLASRSPVLVPDATEPSGRRYWGMTVVVVDYDKVLERAGLSRLEPLHDIAIRGRDAEGAAGQIFHGRPELFEAPRATAEVAVPGGSWLIAVRPKSGWEAASMFGEPWLPLGVLLSLLFSGLGFRIASDRMAIRDLAMSDPLTRLPNRRHVQWVLLEALEQLGGRVRCGALVLIDLDDFKPINDTLGHRVGDEVLRGISTRMRAAISTSDFLARIGGDEFLLVHSSPEPQCRADVESVATRMLAAIAQSVVVDDHAIAVRASMGIALFPEHGRDPNVLRECADRALYRAKRDGGNRAIVYVRGSHDINRTSGKHRVLPPG